MVCACELSAKHKHVLCYSTMCFIHPAALVLFYSGNNPILGTLALVLGFTSLLYHANHTPARRFFDVTVIHAMSIIGAAQLALHIHSNGISLAAVASYLALLTCMALNFLPTFRQSARPDVLDLPGHVALHVATGAALLLMANV